MIESAKQKHFAISQSHAPIRLAPFGNQYNQVIKLPQ
jgi:hypothetical protein